MNLFLMSMIPAFFCFRQYSRTSQKVAKSHQDLIPQLLYLRQSRYMSVNGVSERQLNANLDATCNRMGLKSSTKHIFLCADQTKPKCCNSDVNFFIFFYIFVKCNN